MQVLIPWHFPEEDGVAYNPMENMATKKDKIVKNTATGDMCICQSSADNPCQLWPAARNRNRNWLKKAVIENDKASASSGCNRNLGGP